MNTWHPPFRIAIVRNDLIAMQAFSSAMENNKMWEIMVANSFWEACCLATICGLHAIFIGENLDENDLTIEQFDQARFFACRRLPIPYLLIKTSAELNVQRFPLTRAIKSTGIVNILKTELAQIVQEISTRNTPYSKYTEFQFNSFVKGELEQVGDYHLSSFPMNYLLFAQSWAYFVSKKFDECEKLVNKYLFLYPDNPFFNACLSILHYHNNKTDIARKKLEFLLNVNNLNPFYLYIVFTIVDYFKDIPLQKAIVHLMDKNFPDAYISRLSLGIWNCRCGEIELGIIQLIGCLEKIPQDYIAAAELNKVLLKHGYKGSLHIKHFSTFRKTFKLSALKDSFS